MHVLSMGYVCDACDVVPIYFENGCSMYFVSYLGHMSCSACNE